MAQRYQLPDGRIVEENPGGGYRVVSGGGAIGPAIGNNPMLPGQITTQQQTITRNNQEIGAFPTQQRNAQLSGNKTQQDIDFKPREFQANETASLRGEFDKHPAVERYREAIPAVADALTAPDTPAGDRSIVYAFGKTMDPIGSVQQGEQQSAAGIGSLVGRAKSYLDMVNAGQRLPADARKWLQDATRSRAIALNQAYTQARHRYQDLATKQGFDAELVVGPHEGEPFQKQEGAYLGRPVRNGPPQPKTASPEDFDRLLGDMFERQVPVAEIRQTLKDYGSTIPPWQEKILDQYESARTSGRNTQVGVNTLPGESVGMGLAKGFKGAWDRAAIGLQGAYNAIPGLPDSNSANQAQQMSQDYFSGQRVDPTADTIGRLAGATLFSSPIRNPLAAGAAGNLLMTDSTGGAAVKDAAVGAAGGQLADWGLRGVAGLVAPQGRDAMRRLHQQGTRFSPGQMIGGWARGIEDRLTANPVLGPRIDAIREEGVQGANRILPNRALGHIGQQLPENVPAGHDATDHTYQAFRNEYDDILNGQTIGLDPTLITRFNAIGQRARLRPQELNELGEIVQREIGGAFQENGSQLGAMSGRGYKELDERLGDMVAGFGASDDPYRRQLGTVLGDVRDQMRGLVRRQNPEMGARIRAADEGYANFAIQRRAAASNPATGLYGAGQLRNAVRAQDRSVGKGATARGQARAQDLASDMSETMPSTVGSSGTSEREQVNKVAPWVVGSLLSPLYSDGAEQVLARTLLREPDVTSRRVANMLRALPRGMFGGYIPSAIQSGSGY